MKYSDIIFGQRGHRRHPAFELDLFFVTEEGRKSFFVWFCHNIKSLPQGAKLSSGTGSLMRLYFQSRDGLLPDQPGRKKIMAVARIIAKSGLNIPMMMEIHRSNKPMYVNWEKGKVTNKEPFDQKVIRELT